MPIVQRLPLNTAGRDFVVGDIHGAFELVYRAMDTVGFDPACDRLFSVGDLIDRGPASERCVEFIRNASVFPVRGNHEDMLLELYADGPPSPEALDVVAQYNGFKWWLQTSDEQRHDILEAIGTLPLALEVETERGRVGLVHADVPLGLDWPTFIECLEAGVPWARQTALWGRQRLQSEIHLGVPGIDRVFIGHTIQWDGARQYGNVFALDTGAVFGLLGDGAGHLTFAHVLSRTDVLSNSAPDGLVRVHSAGGTGPFGSYCSEQPLHRPDELAGTRR